MPFTRKNKGAKVVEKPVDNIVYDYILSTYNANNEFITVTYADIIDTLRRYEVLIKAGNYRKNLVSNRDVDNLWKKHFLPSLKPLERGLIPPGVKCLDAGAGAGLPGIPLKIMRRDLDLTLLEANRKKTLFLRNVREELGLEGVTIIQGRVEDMEDKFDIVFSRAMGKPEITVPLLRARVNQGGKVILWTGKGESVDFLGGSIREIDIEAGGKLVIIEG